MSSTNRNQNTKPPVNKAANQLTPHPPAEQGNSAGRSLQTVHEKLRVGWFMQCPACGMTFILTTPADCVVNERARILKRKPTGHKRASVALVRCPNCLSRNVRLTEVGDGK